MLSIDFSPLSSSPFDKIEEAMVAEPASNVAGSINPDRSFDITDVNASDGVAVGGGGVEL